MKFNRSTILYTIAALITVYGLVTGRFIFILLALPLGLFNYTKDNSDKK